MSGYLRFERTGLASIDEILIAVERAGNLFHHTEGWTENYPHDSDPTMVGLIQNAAAEACALVRNLEGLNEQLNRHERELTSENERLAQDKKDWIDRCYGAETKNERLKNDLADALDLKMGVGPTVLTALVTERDRLRQENERLEGECRERQESFDLLVSTSYKIKTDLDKAKATLARVTAGLTREGIAEILFKALNGSRMSSHYAEPYDRVKALSMADALLAHLALPKTGGGVMIFKDKRMVEIPTDEFLAALGLKGWKLEMINKYEPSQEIVMLVVMKEWSSPLCCPAAGRHGGAEVTPEELIARCNHTSFAKVDSADVHGACANCIRAAIAEERESCAKMAELDSSLDWIGGSTGNAKGTSVRIAQAIRGRAE